MSLETTKRILDKIKEYNRIILFRHKRPDGDAVGSTMGLAEIIRATFPEKEVYVQNTDYAKYLEFLGGEGEIIADELYADALGIVMDTATLDRVSNPKYQLCREIIKIDHHIPVQSYGVIEWVEELRSSCCEMVAAFYDYNRDELKISPRAALFIYTGMVTDSGRFRFRDVSSETLRLAGVILSVGIDTETLYANLYLKEFDDFKFEAFAHEKMEITENGVANLYVTKEIQEQWGLTNEQASNSVSFMDSIKGSLIWLAFIDNPDGSIRVRLRSRFVTVSELAERYHGGGHACAAGATVYSEEERIKLLEEANALLGEYKATHEGWL
jgi:phosphoesterase RecJ-like protein